MNMYKQPISIHLMFASGIILTTFPMLFKDYFHLPDFFRGLAAGLGRGLEIAAMKLGKRNQRSGSRFIIDR